MHLETSGHGGSKDLEIGEQSTEVHAELKFRAI